MSKKVGNLQAILNVVCAVLLLALVVCQFLPFWHYDTDNGYSASVQGMTWFPHHHSELSSKSNFRVTKVPFTKEVAEIDGVEMLPVETIAKDLGYDVVVNADKTSAELTRNKQSISLEVGSAEYKIGTKTETMDNAPVYHQDEIYASADFMEDAMGVEVVEGQIEETIEPADIESYFNKELKSDLDLKEMSLYRISLPGALMLLLAVGGILLCILKRKNWMPALLALACGGIGIWAYLTPVFQMGTGWMIYLVLSAVIVAAAVASVIVGLSASKKEEA